MNIAYIDGQNLYMGTTKCPTCAKSLGKNIKVMKIKDCTCGCAWKVDCSKFRAYLKEKYSVKKAYYFLGYESKEHQDLYDELKKADFIIKFKEHYKNITSKKKGNVDTDIVFDIMKRICERERFNKIVLVSGDGDYKKLVDYLIEKNKFEKILFPNKIFNSSLYKDITHTYSAHLEDIKDRIRL